MHFDRIENVTILLVNLKHKEHYKIQLLAVGKKIKLKTVLNTVKLYFPV